MPSLRPTRVVATLLAAAAILVERPITDGFVDDDIAVTDLDVVQARWICANPGFILDRSSLATEIRKRNQITFTTLATAGKCIFHEIASFLLSGGNMHLSLASTGVA